MSAPTILEDLPRGASRAVVLRFLRLPFLFEQGAAIGTRQGDDIQRARDMLVRLLKRGLDQRIAEEILFEGHEGYLLQTPSRGLDPTDSVGEIRDFLKSAIAYIDAVEVLAASGKSEANTDSADTAIEAARKEIQAVDSTRTPTGESLAVVMTTWLQSYARASMQEFEVEVAGKVFRLRIPSKNRIQTRGKNLPTIEDAHLARVARAGVRSACWCVTTVTGERYAILASDMKDAPKRGVKVRVRTSMLSRRTSTVPLMVWRPVSPNTDGKEVRQE